MFTPMQYLQEKWPLGSINRRSRSSWLDRRSIGHWKVLLLSKGRREQKKNLFRWTCWHSEQSRKLNSSSSRLLPLLPVNNHTLCFMLIPFPFPHINHTHHSTLSQSHSLLVACYHIFIKIAIYDPSCKNILSPKAVFPHPHHPLGLVMKQLCKYTVLVIIVHKLSSFMLNHSYKEAIERESQPPTELQMDQW